MVIEQGKDIFHRSLFITLTPKFIIYNKTKYTIKIKWDDKFVKNNKKIQTKDKKESKKENNNIKLLHEPTTIQEAKRGNEKKQNFENQEKDTKTKNEKNEEKEKISNIKENSKLNKNKKEKNIKKIHKYLIKSNQIKPVYKFSEQTKKLKHIRIKIKKKYEWSKTFSIVELGTEVLKIWDKKNQKFKLIRIKIQNEKILNNIIFTKEYVGSPKYLIKNNTPHIINYWQKGCLKNEKINSNQQVSYYWEDFKKSHNIMIHLSKFKITKELSFEKKKKHYSLDLNNNYSNHNNNNNNNYHNHKNNNHNINSNNNTKNDDDSDSNSNTSNDNNINNNVSGNRDNNNNIYSNPNIPSHSDTNTNTTTTTNNNNNCFLDIYCYQKGPTKIILFEKREKNIKLNKNLKFSQLINSDKKIEKEIILVNLHSFGVSVIQNYIELLYLSILGINFKYNKTTIDDHFEFSIDKLQLNNQSNIDVLYPVTLTQKITDHHRNHHDSDYQKKNQKKKYKQNENENNEKILKLILCRNLINKDFYFIPYFSILIQTLLINLEEDFLIEVMVFFQKSKLIDLFFKILNFKFIIFKKDKMAEEINQQSNFGFNLISKVDYFNTQGYKRQKEWFFNLLFINPIQLILNFELSNSHIKNPLTNFLRVISTTLTSIHSADIRLNSLVLNDTFLISDLIKELFIRHYKYSLFKQIYNLIGGLDLIGVPITLFKGFSNGLISFFVEPAKGFMAYPSITNLGKGLTRGTKDLVTESLDGVFNSASKFIGTLGTGISVMTMDKEFTRSRIRDKHLHPTHNIGDGLVYGGWAFGKGIWSGVSGIISQPIRGFHKRGKYGAITGIGKGIMGLVTKPMIGITDFATNVTDGLKNTSHKIPIKLERTRVPRNFDNDTDYDYDYDYDYVNNYTRNKKKLKIYDLENSLSQIIIHSNIQLINEKIKFCQICNQNKEVSIIQTVNWIICSKNYNVNWKIKISNFFQIEKNVEKLILKFKFFRKDSIIRSKIVSHRIIFDQSKNFQLVYYYFFNLRNRLIGDNSNKREEKVRGKGIKEENEKENEKKKEKENENEIEEEKGKEKDEERGKGNK
ncbi:vacuolar protein sorting-associated protein vps13 [Anaeramoeba flamelloides]|uniref:Vacuolar protein sorting-associated protein vps13 n=1 Tax=Anaeramoeba flamelloides TaxID=1746091 RepID=A0ABQ8YQB0_9EUKA|nr:vacuolar protein sorting-associated protein vps13 [Anaeramoeba flamelloides]